MRHGTTASSTLIEALGHAVVVTHLSPASSSARTHEASALVAAVLADGRPALVLGDMNTLSPADPISEATMTALQSTPRLRQSFADDLSAPDFAPMQMILSSLIDLGDPSDWSVPSSLKVDMMHAAKMRLDFALATSSFMGLSDDHARLQAHAVHDTTTMNLSDHLPLVVQRVESDDTTLEL